MTATKKTQPKIKTTNKTKLLTLTGLFSALIYVVTAYVHIPTGVGYTHAGDGLIYLAASILPMPYAVAASAIGGALADGLTGFVIWMPATIIIKSLTAMFFSNKTDKIICKRNVIAIIPSLLACIVGYSIYEGIIIAEKFSISTIALAFAQTPFYVIQIIASSILYILLGKAFDKAKIKTLILI